MKERRRASVALPLVGACLLLFGCSAEPNDTDGEGLTPGAYDGDDGGAGDPDAGHTDGGDTDGGSTDGGDTDGGGTDGGDTDGGGTDGGGTDGGGTDGGGTDPDVGVVVCGVDRDVFCELPAQVCCQGLFGAECKAPAECSDPLTAPAECDGPEDCPESAPICCAVFDWSGGSGTFCRPACDGTAASAIMCHADDECVSPRTCQSCQPPGGGAQQMCVESCPY